MAVPERIAAALQETKTLRSWPPIIQLDQLKFLEFFYTGLERHGHFNPADAQGMHAEKMSHSKGPGQIIRRAVPTAVWVTIDRQTVRQRREHRGERKLTCDENMMTGAQGALQFCEYWGNWIRCYDLAQH